MRFYTEVHNCIPGYKTSYLGANLFGETDLWQLIRTPTLSTKIISSLGIYSEALPQLGMMP
jgi:hypothetical protein